MFVKQTTQPQSRALKDIIVILSVEHSHLVQIPESYKGHRLNSPRSIRPTHNMSHWSESNCSHTTVRNTRTVLMWKKPWFGVHLRLSELNGVGGTHVCNQLTSKRKSGHVTGTSLAVAPAPPELSHISPRLSDSHTHCAQRSPPMGFPVDWPKDVFG